MKIAQRKNFFARALPVQREQVLHEQLVELLQRFIAPGWQYTHIPSGEERPLLVALKLQRMGLVPGWPDFLFVGQRRVFFLELKRKGAGLSEAQAAISEHLLRNGCGYFVTDDFSDAVLTLRDMGIVSQRVTL